VQGIPAAARIRASNVPPGFSPAASRKAHRHGLPSIIVFGYGAGGMRRRYAASIAAILLAAGTPIASASDTALRLVDADGVVHLTNVPADPRYRGLRGASGTGAGWLRLPARSWIRYAADIEAIAREHGVSPALIEAVVRTESGFDPTAVSPKGAGGLMQLMPKTASALGVVDRFDPHESIRGGVRHLRYLLERYQGSVVLALAAYNAGEGAVDAHRGVPPYPETQQYVQRVLRRAGLADSLGNADALYRYAGPDDVVTYSNLPSRPRH
jgi:soluble lytic murein transglycosylase-like protein